MRKLASVQKIISLTEIIDPKTNLPAQNIEAAQVLGWTVVVKKNLHKINELVVYIEIDSILPEWLLKSQGLWDETKGKGVLGKSAGNTLKTKKLLGVVSQGLVASIGPLVDVKYHKEDTEVTDVLGIKKYEQYIEEEFEPGKKGKQSFKHRMIRRFKPQLRFLSQYIPYFRKFVGFAAEPFPSFIQKTDQTRIQNLTRNWEELRMDNYELTEKCEGTSSTYFYYNGDFGMCSRNLRKKNDDNTHFGQIEKKHNIFEKLIAYKKNIAIQGEICGPGIQGNYYSLPEFTLFIFDIYLIDERRKASPRERGHILVYLGLANHQAPLLSVSAKLDGKSIQEVLEDAIVKSKINPKVDAEGKVYKSLNKNQSFKAINNNYLLKQK